MENIGYSRMPISQEFLDWLGVSFTMEELKSCDQDKFLSYIKEINTQMKTKPRWVFAFRHRFGEPGFFTEWLPKFELERESS